MKDTNSDSKIQNEDFSSDQWKDGKLRGNKISNMLMQGLMEDENCFTWTTESLLWKRNLLKLLLTFSINWEFTNNALKLKAIENLAFTG